MGSTRKQKSFNQAIKIDVEGSEYEILKHFFDLNLEKRILNISLEIHGRKNGKEDTNQFKWLTKELNKRFDVFKFKFEGRKDGLVFK